MNKSLYNSASAIFALNRNMEIKSHNISNIDTVGYKYNNYHNGVFEDIMLSHNNKQLGELPTRVGITEISTVFSQGAFMNTERNLDIAIAGDAYIKVDKGNGIPTYTRNGNLKVDRDGFLVDYAGNYILGENGHIQVGNPNEISFSKDGTILSDGKRVDKLIVTALDNPSKLTPNYFTADKEVNSDNYSINQGYLEASNVDLSKELVDVISIQRLLSTNSKMLQTEDELNKRIIDGIK